MGPPVSAREAEQRSFSVSREVATCQEIERGASGSRTPCPPGPAVSSMPWLPGPPPGPLAVRTPSPAPQASLPLLQRRAALSLFPEPAFSDQAPALGLGFPAHPAHPHFLFLLVIKTQTGLVEPEGQWTRARRQIGSRQDLATFASPILLFFLFLSLPEYSTVSKFVFF